MAHNLACGLLTRHLLLCTSGLLVAKNAPFDPQITACEPVFMPRERREDFSLKKILFFKVLKTDGGGTTHKQIFARLLNDEHMPIVVS